MRFSYKSKTLRSVNTHESSARIEMSAREEEVTEIEIDASGGNEENSVRFSSDLVDERLKRSREPLHAQISALTEMMDRLIQGNSVRELTMASTRDLRYQYESPFSGAPETSQR